MKLIKLKLKQYLFLMKPEPESENRVLDILDEWRGNFVVGNNGIGVCYYFPASGTPFCEMPPGFVDDWEATHKKPEKLPHGPGIGFTVDAGSEALRLIDQHLKEHTKKNIESENQETFSKLLSSPGNGYTLCQIVEAILSQGINAGVVLAVLKRLEELSETSRKGNMVPECCEKCDCFSSDSVMDILWTICVHPDTDKISSEPGRIFNREEYDRDLDFNPPPKWCPLRKD